MSKKCNWMLVRVSEEDWQYLHNLRFKLHKERPNDKMPTLTDAAHFCIDYFAKLDKLKQIESEV